MRLKWYRSFTSYKELPLIHTVPVTPFSSLPETPAKFHE